MIVIITPYRDRPKQKETFLKHMKDFLAKKCDPFLIVVSEQSDDSRAFNRGAMKNIGYLEAKAHIGELFREAIYVNQDIDVLPNSQECIYAIPDENTIYNPYGVQHCLAKIHIQSAKMMETTNGYPNNYWAWGLEDVCVQARADTHGFKTDRTHFEWLGTNNMWIEQEGEENTRTWREGNLDTVRRLYEYEAVNPHTCWDNGLTTIKYTLNQQLYEDNVLHIIAHIDKTGLDDLDI